MRKNGKKFEPSPVTGDVYYHVQKISKDNKDKPKFDVGQTYTIGKNKNYFIGDYDELKLKIVETSSLVELFIEYEWILTEYRMFIREYIFEEIRKESFPDLPSRHNCLWVIPPNIDGIKYWWDIISKSKDYTCEILKLELTGHIYKTNAWYLKETITPFNRMRGEAFKYWSGNAGNDPREDEYLFEGTVKVLKICDYKYLSTELNHE